MFFSTTFKYIISVLHLFCVTVYSYQSAKAESVGYCAAISIVCVHVGSA